MQEIGLLDAFKHNPLFFVAGGVVGIVSLLLALVGLALVTKSWKATIVLGVLGLLGGVATGGIGSLGMLQTQWMTESALSIPDLSASERQRIREIGEQESMYHLLFNGVLAILPVVAGLGAVGAGAVVRRRK